MDETEIPAELVVPLREPIDLGNLAYTELKLREPTAAQVAMWDKLSGTEADIMAVAVVSGVPKSVVEKLKIRDLTVASRYIARFLA